MYSTDIPLPELIIEGEIGLKFYFLPYHLKYLLGEILRNIYKATIKDHIRRETKTPEPIFVTIIKNSDSYLVRISDRASCMLQRDETIWSFGKSKESARESLENFHKLPDLQTISIYDRSHQFVHKLERYQHASIHIS